MAKGSKHINHGVQVNDDGDVYIRVNPDAVTSGFNTTSSGRAGEIAFYIDESGHNLKASVVYSNGTTSKTLTVAFD
jgi:hypothetical protein